MHNVFAFTAFICSAVHLHVCLLIAHIPSCCSAPAQKRKRSHRSDPVNPVLASDVDVSGGMPLATISPPGDVSTGFVELCSTFLSWSLMFRNFSVALKKKKHVARPHWVLSTDTPGL